MLAVCAGERLDMTGASRDGQDMAPAQAEEIRALPHLAPRPIANRQRPQVLPLAEIRRSVKERRATHSADAAADDLIP